LSRGLIADREELIRRLKVVSYYRLSGYWYPFRNPDDTLQSGTTLDHVWRRYTFDRELRLLVLDAIDRVEIAVRTSLAYCHCHAYGPFGYLNVSSLPGWDAPTFTRFQWKLKDEVRRSQEAFVVHFKGKYGDVHPELPLWMAAELMSFGMVFTLFRGMEKTIKRQVSAEFDVAFKVMESWLSCLNAIRNICAHHGRLWNRVLGVKPLIPAKNPQWHTPVEVHNDRTFAVLVMLRYMLGVVAPQSRWHDRVEVLIVKYPDIPLPQMGFPQDWRDSPIWHQR
jgi:abortive infection bacteriophage resistance protein